LKLRRPLVAALTILALTPAMSEYTTVSPETVVGDIEGAHFQVQVPYPWNGTLVLYSHGYQSRGSRVPDPPADAPDTVTQHWLLDHGYALAGSGYSQQGWAVEQAFHDQIALLRLVNIHDPAANFPLAASLLKAAQATPAGRARLALAAAVSGVPGWYDPGDARPPASNYAGREVGQFTWDARLDFYFGFFLRQEIERRAGGNPSWNTGVDYTHQLQLSSDRSEVAALYRVAGLDMDQDLQTLAGAPRVAAYPRAVGYLDSYFRASGQIRVPVLTLHNTGDGLVLPDDELAYANSIRAAGDQALLRQAFVERAGHCAFTPSETLAAFVTLVGRLDSGRWGQTMPVTLNTAAAALGVGRSAFIAFKPTYVLRLVEKGQHQLSKARLGG
jgi:hypothetical protein